MLKEKCAFKNKEVSISVQSDKCKELQDMENEEKIINKVPKDFEPIYVTKNSNQDIELVTSEPVEFEFNGETVRSHAKVFLELFPQPFLKIMIEHVKKGNQLFTMSQFAKGIKFIDRNVSFENAFVYQVSNYVYMSPDFSHVIALKKEASLSKVIFHLINFSEFYGDECCIFQPKVSSVYLSKRINYIVLNADGWVIDLWELRETSEKYRDADTRKSHFITHAGKIERLSKNPFCSEKAQDILSALFFFLSFAEGDWCGLSLPVGFNSNEEKIWEEWGYYKISDSHHHQSWWCRHRSQDLNAIFSGFLKYFQHEKWKDALSKSIHWYVEANNGGDISTCIVLTQTALELLAYTYVVEDKQLLSAKGFKDLWASDRLRLLLGSLNIPTDIPSELKEVAKVQQKHKWIDVTQVFTDIRNEIIHPDHKKRGEFNDLYVEAWDVGVVLLELVMLKLFNYNGHWVNRLKRGEWRGATELVPWATV